MFQLPKTVSSGLAATLLALIAGCASAPLDDASPTFAVRPVADEPQFAFLWNDQVTSWRYLKSEPVEFAAPSHVGSSDELVVATSQGEVVKYQAANGEVLWRSRFPESTFHAGPVVGQGRVYVTDLEGRIRALDMYSGELVWETKISNSIETRGTWSNGRLFVSDAADVLWAFDGESGDRLWTHSREVPEFFTVKGSCAPVPDNDVVYCGFSDGHLVALRADTGEPVWDVDLSGGNDAFVDVDDRVFLVGSRIYAVSYSGGIYALERATGTIIWRRDVESAADVEISDGRLFVASAMGRVSALDLETGEPLWAFAFQRALPGSLGSFGPYLLAFTTTGPVYILDAKTGYPFKKWRGTTGFLAPVERGSSRLYAMSNYGELFGLKLGY